MLRLLYYFMLVKYQEIINKSRIQNIDFQNRNCEVGLDIIPKYRGKGYGKKSYEMLLEFLFMHYNMNMVYLKVAGFNPDAKKLYEKAGFLKTGYLPLYYYRYGKYWDYIIMSLTKEQYIKLNSLMSYKSYMEIYESQ